MDIAFLDLQGDIIYHANIFNYDKKFFQQYIPKKKKLMFSLAKEEIQPEDIEKTVKFFKEKPKKQIENLITLVGLRENQEEAMNIISTDPEQQEEVQIEQVAVNKDAEIVIKHILKLLSFTASKLSISQEENNEEEQKDHETNMLTCLLFLDGLCMINIELARPINILSKENEISFVTALEMVLDMNNLPLQTREVASHLLSIYLMMSEEDPNTIKEQAKKLLEWTHTHSIANTRENCLTSNLCLLLTIDPLLEEFYKEFDPKTKCVSLLFEHMTKEDSNINTIYESLFCMWNISNNKEYLEIFENQNEKYIEKLVQVIRTNKIDKIARIGLMTIKNLLENETCVEGLFNIKFMRTIDILLTNKWNDPAIKELLSEIYDFLDKNYKIMNSFDKYVKELQSGTLKNGSLHSVAFWEENYKNFEADNFDNIRRLIIIIRNPNIPVEQKSIACFDLGEFSRLYPNGASVMEYFGAKDILLNLIQHTNLELKNRALVCLQKIMMRSLKK